jgi:acyl carrier protein
MAQTPEPDVAAVVCRAWEQHLGAPPADPADHFFRAGGNSLQAAELMATLSREFRRRLRLSVLLHNPRLEDLTRAVAELIR